MKYSVSIPASVVAAPLALCSILIAFSALPVSAQMQPLAQEEIAVDVDSGVLRNDGDEYRVVWSERVSIDPERAWIRLRFDTAVLAEDPATSYGSFLRITSVLDGAEQILDPVALRQWNYTSAYFNGNEVDIELVARPNGRGNRVWIRRVWGGAPGAYETICDGDDDRLPSNDVRAARAVPIGCSAWLIGARCMLSAGHCAGGSFDVIEFNVPLSDSGGNIQHPPPEDQYSIDPASVQTEFTVLGNDWLYYGVFPNSNTGLDPFEAQGDAYVLADTPPPVSGQDIRITGYGTMSSPPEWNQIQKTHVGPYSSLSGTVLQYRTDTTGGNSGSAVVDESTGLAIGIHTNGGCGNGSGANSGTGVNNTGLRDALANPQGVCATGLAFDYPEGRPDFVHPTLRRNIRVEVRGVNGAEVAPGTPMLLVDFGSGETQIALTAIGGDLYEAPFPRVPCLRIAHYRFTAEDLDGGVFVDPPSSTYQAISTRGTSVSFEDDFQQDLGWTVVNVDLDDGPWERGVPAGDGDRGDPLDDYDGSGACYLTDNVAGNSDVDGGPTRLISPPLDLSAGVGWVIEYARWLTNDDNDDLMVVEISNDDGTSWVEVESAGPATGWVPRRFAVHEYLLPSNQVRVRFSVADNPNDSVTEAGLDAFRVVRLRCESDVDLPTIPVATPGAPGPIRR